MSNSNQVGGTLCISIASTALFGGYLRELSWVVSSNSNGLDLNQLWILTNLEIWCASIIFAHSQFSPNPHSLLVILWYVHIILRGNTCVCEELDLITTSGHQAMMYLLLVVNSRPISLSSRLGTKRWCKSSHKMNILLFLTYYCLRDTNSTAAQP